MAINASAYWRVRIGGADTNAGGFDPAIVGAGTDYTEQDTPQLTVTDLAAAGAGTTLTSATGGFTSAMIGNAFALTGGTGFTAGRYFIVGVTNGNTIITDRNASAGAASGGNCKVGGAFATVYLCTASYAVPGNAVYIRGQGSNNPVDIDYYTATNVNSGTSDIAYIGYNGRPKISHRGELWWQQNNGSWENLYFIQTSAVSITNGALGCGGYGGGCLAYNCVFDTGGFDATQVVNVSCIQCTFQNTGGQTAGTRACYMADSNGPGFGAVLLNSLIKDQRAAGVSIVTKRSCVIGNVVQNCLGDGIIAQDENNSLNFSMVYQNTVHNCGGDGLSMQTGNLFGFGNLVTGINGAGKYGLKIRNSIKGSSRASGTRASRNNFYNCANNSNISLGSTDLTINPNYVNAPIDLTPTNTALRVIGGVGAL